MCGVSSAVCSSEESMRKQHRHTSDDVSKSSSVKRSLRRSRNQQQEHEISFCGSIETEDDKDFGSCVTYDMNLPLHLPLIISTNVGRNNPRSTRDAATSMTPCSTISTRNKWNMILRISICATFLVLPLLITASNDSKIGDRVRSKESSFSFFSWVDRDGDGVLKRKEMENFIRNSIGGSEYDTDNEVNSEVDRLMESLDQNNDENLDYSDVFSYWKQLENLLTIKEVNDWILYALQLPESVAKAFEEHSVTGYDFPELMENDGEAIETELGIEKVALRKKLLRSMRVKLLGMGSVPGEPLKVTHHLESCNSIIIEWKKPEAISYPVHSYRVQRRSIPLLPRFNNVSKESKDTNISDAEKNISNIEKSHSIISTQWETIYFGPDTHYLDSFIDLDYRIMYRVQAWNAIGHSNWIVKDITSSLKRQKCYEDDDLLSPTFREEPFQYIIWNTLYVCKILYSIVFDWFTPLVYHIVQMVCTLLAVTGALVRYRRANAPSSSFPRTKPIMPWLWNIINHLSIWLLGHTVVPDQLLENFETRDYGISRERNVTLRRAHSNRSDTVKIQSSKNPYRSNDVVTLQRKQSRSTEASSKSDTVTGKSFMAEKKNLNKRKLSVRRLFSKTSQLDSIGDQSNREISPLLSSSLQEYYSRSRPQSDIDICNESLHLNNDNEELSIENDLVVNTACQPCVMAYDDDQHCNYCGKGFRFGKRWKHHCARCLSVFCHKHGHITHKNISSCKVPGDCVCNFCLEKD